MGRSEEIQMVAHSIIDLATDRKLKGEPYQDVNSAIHGVLMEIKQEIMEHMRRNRYEINDPVTSSRK